MKLFRFTLPLMCLFNFQLTAGSQDNKVTFAYQSASKTLTASGDLCTYGKKSKSTLPQSVINHIQSYVAQQKNGFITQIRDINKGMFGRRLSTAELSVMYQLNEKNIVMDYYFEGNQACTHFVATTELNFDSDGSEYFTFSSPKSWTFVAKHNDITQITTAIKSVYPNISIDQNQLKLIQQKDNQSLIELARLSKSYTLYKFNAEQFNKSMMLTLNTVFVEGVTPYNKALEQYLTSYQYQIAANKQEANWLFEISPQSSSQGILFTISYQAKDITEKHIKNDPAALPIINTNSEQELQDLILLHLEMMEFVDVLK